MSSFEEGNSVQSSTPEGTETTGDNQPVTQNPFIQEDIEIVRKLVPEAAILTLTPQVITVVIIRTQYSRVQLRLQYPENYPNELPIVELASHTLPMPLLRNKEKECLDKAKENIGKAQFFCIYENIYNFIHTNMFIPCWKEMKEINKLMEGKGQIGCNEKEGIISIRLIANNYKFNVKLTIPENYPETGVQFEFLQTNIPADLIVPYKAISEELVKKCEAGFTAEQALSSITSSGSSDISKLKAAGQGSANKGDKEIKLTTSSLKSLKHDVNILKQMTDLRQASQTSVGKYDKQALQSRKEARRDLRKLAKAENEMEQEMLQKELEEENNLIKNLLNLKVSEKAQLSLTPLVTYLINNFFDALTKETCQVCNNFILNRNQEEVANEKLARKNRPVRAICGHHFHYSCLDTHLTTPPFLRNCIHCNRRIRHNDWPEDIKQIEKAWQSKEAKKREMEEISDLMGF